jgi:dolichyl-phosphate-mannose--protein O-mannosyl transferase
MVCWLRSHRLQVSTIACSSAECTWLHVCLCRFVNIGEQYGPNCKFMALRVTSAVFGCFMVPLMYGIARQWGVSVRGALLAGLLLNFDGLNTIEGRLILMDSQLMFWYETHIHPLPCITAVVVLLQPVYCRCAASLFAAQLWWKRLNGHATAEDVFLAKHGKVFNVMDATHRNTSTAFMSLTEKYMWLVGMGILCANAVSVKWTGLATPGLIAIESFFGFFFLKKPVKFVDGCVIVLVAFLTYAWYFYCHFALLPLSGDGDGFMRVEFQRTLKNNPNYDPNASSPLFWKSFIQVWAFIVPNHTRRQCPYHPDTCS